MALMDTLREITTLRRSIEEQRHMLSDFLRSNQDNMQLVRTELKGSTRGYDQRMLGSLQQAEASLNKSINALGQAADALQRVEMI